jgi:glycine/D-amino acid oxidase-like deaminating enzyme
MAEPRRCSLDETSPFERVRMLDLEPAQGVLDQAQASIAAAFPALRDVAIAKRWAGLIDVTSRRRAGDLASRQPARLLRRHRPSGHGFGIGPDGGKLIADLVTGDPVDPASFRNSRFAAGDYPPPSALAT